ncbi:MAG: division/cell wall cluster transcriptional repressor MraZ [bacterium]
MGSFRGSFRHTLDSKGRLALASPFRRVTGIRLKDGPQPLLILTKGFNGCVWAFLEEGWMRIEERLRDKQFKDQESRDFVLEMALHLQEVPIDAAGRILIPQSHLSLAGLERGKDVLALGMLDHLELWNPAKYDEHMAKKRSSYEENSRELFGS